MQTPIHKMVASAVRCTICGAGYGKCDCWTKCGKCGWTYEKGTKCLNCLRIKLSPQEEKS